MTQCQVLGAVNFLVPSLPPYSDSPSNPVLFLALLINGSTPSGEVSHPVRCLELVLIGIPPSFGPVAVIVYGLGTSNKFLPRGFRPDTVYHPPQSAFWQALLLRTTK